MQITNFNYNYFITNYNMNFYEKYLKYKTKYLLLNKINKNQIGGSHTSSIYPQYNFRLPYKIKDNKKDIFIDIVIWIAKVSNYLKDLSKNGSVENGFDLPFTNEFEQINKENNEKNYYDYKQYNNFIEMRFDFTNDGLHFKNDLRCTYNEINELIEIINNISNLLIPETLNTYELYMNNNTNNIKSRIEFLFLKFKDEKESFVDNSSNLSSNCKFKIGDNVLVTGKLVTNIYCRGDIGKNNFNENIFNNTPGIVHSIEKGNQYNKYKCIYCIKFNNELFAPEVTEDYIKIKQTNLVINDYTLNLNNQSGTQIYNINNNLSYLPNTDTNNNLSYLPNNNLSYLLNNLYTESSINHNSSSSSDLYKYDEDDYNKNDKNKVNNKIIQFYTNKINKIISANHKTFLLSKKGQKVIISILKNYILKNDYTWNKLKNKKIFDKLKEKIIKKIISKYNQKGGSDIVLYNSNFMNLSQKIKDNKRDLFIDIILWIFQDSKYNKGTKKYDNGFEFITNSAKLIFNNNNDGFIFIDDNKASKDEMFELSFIIKNIIELQVTKNFKILDLFFNENKKNIYTRINFIKNFFITQENNELESISQPKQQIAPIRKDISPIRKDISPIRKDISPSRKDRSPSRKDRSPSRKDRSPSRKDRSPSRKDRSPSRKDLESTRKDIESTRKDIESTRKDISPSRKDRSPSRKDRSPSRKDIGSTRKDRSPSRKETKIIDDFEPNTFFPNDMIVGTFEYIPYKREKDEFSSTISEFSSTISKFNTTINSEFNTTIKSEYNIT